MATKAKKATADKEIITGSDKKAALETVMQRIERECGKGSIMRLGQTAGDTTIEALPTGCLSLDLAIGIGGLPRGRIIEIYGPESSGKTTVALHAVAEAQKMGGVAAFIDAAEAVDEIFEFVDHEDGLAVDGVVVRLGEIAFDDAMDDDFELLAGDGAAPDDGVAVVV